ncbi:hypothetical protein VNI00_004816, partial [Paramarasmius palmivorus]
MQEWLEQPFNMPLDVLVVRGSGLGRSLDGDVEAALEMLEFEGPVKRIEWEGVIGGNQHSDLDSDDSLLARI